MSADAKGTIEIDIRGDRGFALYRHTALRHLKKLLFVSFTFLECHFGSEPD
jgi:hypothetical protein